MQPKNTYPQILIALGAALALAVSTTARASLVVYEGFNYAGQSDNAALSGAAFNGGTGLSGTWAGPGKYRTGGLMFSDLAVAGGCAEGANSDIYYRKLNVNQTGTIWGSFLFKSVSAVDATITLSSFIVSKQANGNDWQTTTSFGVTPKKYQGTTGDIRLGGNSTNPTAFGNVGGTAVTQGTTYLVLFKVENLIASGAAATSQTITSWILSDAQYDNFKGGGLTETELNSAAQGSGAANVMQRTTLTATQKASFSVNDYLTVQSNNVGDYMHDEIRVSDASLAETAPTGTPAADIYAFGPGATIGPVAANAVAISWTVPFGTNVTDLAPTYTLSPGATCVPASGSSQDFTGPVHYIVQASDFATSGKTTDYTVTVSVTPASSVKNIVAFGPGATISGTNIAWLVPFGSDITTLAPTYSVATFASADALFPSDTPRSFTTPQTYTITAQDTTTQIYTVTVTVAQDESTLIWNVAGDGQWDLTTANWNGQSSGVTMPFDNGKNVIFGNAAGGTITIASGISPTSTTVSATVGTYTFSGGALVGAGTLTKSGNGRLRLYSFSPTPNTYSGGTILNSGILQLGDVFDGGITPYCQNPMGSGLVTLNSGATIECNRVTASNTLIVNGGTIVNYNGWQSTWTGPITLNATLTANLPNYMNLSGSVSGIGGITKTGGGPMDLSGINTYSGNTTVGAGSITLADNAGLRFVLTDGASNKITGPGTATLNGDFTIDTTAVTVTFGTWALVDTTTKSFGSTFSVDGFTPNVDGVTWTITASGKTWTFVETTGVLTLTGGSDFDTWMAGYPSITAPADKLPGTDPDGDGMTNQQEYAFGLNPASGSSVNPITGPLNKTTGIFSYTRRATPATTGLSYTVFTSSNLVTWMPDAGLAQSIATNGAVETVTFTVSNPAVNGKLFVRVQAVPAP